MAQSLLQDKRILLGVCGGIAVYKSVDLVRRLRERGAQVRVVMTADATRFVAPLTFQAVTEQAVYTDLWTDQDRAMPHIDLARWAQLLLIAPASANTMAKLACGMADNLLCAIGLVYEGPLAIAPAMNQSMWSHAATQSNLQTLLSRGAHQFGPAQGIQACGETGAGRMLEPLALVEAVASLFVPKLLRGLRVLITAGPTQEAIDPVRYISNHSSGKMGYALAAAAYAMGARVTLVSGPVGLAPPAGVTRVEVMSSEQMLQSVQGRLAETDVFIAAAAVADYRPLAQAPQKIKKSTDAQSLLLVPTTDILRTVTAGGQVTFVVGFAAETEDLNRHARDKLRNKNCDMIVANRVGQAGSGFGADTNAVTLFWPDGEMVLPTAPKTLLAYTILEQIRKKYDEKTAS